MRNAIISLRNITVDFYSNSSDNFSFKKFLLTRKLLPQKVKIFEGFSLDIYEGEILGIEGSNGIGKTTLLSVMAGIIPITSGQRVVKGRALPLLGLGHVFHGDLDIEKNIELWALSFNSGFIVTDEFITDVLKSAGLNIKKDMLLRSLSSGMKSRLAFELAMRGNEDILLLDEVFSVGDASFKAQSIQRIKDKLQKISCAVIVSHDRSVLEDNCSRIIRIKSKSEFEVC
jgi:ABC-type polysaccharide/polyol phosphate transport system ATPase subunit